MAKQDVAIGIDIGGTNTLIGAVTKGGKIVAQSSINTTRYPDVNDFLKKTCIGISSLVNKSDYKVISVGIGAPNGNYLNGTIESAVNLAWKGDVPLASMIGKELDIPVVLTNDANAAAIGEMMFGEAKGMKNFILLTLGTGLGSGIVVDGKVLYGHTGLAGEFGHVIMVPGGRLCGCGRKGCLETYVSATGIVKTVQSILSVSKKESVLRNMPVEEITSRHISDAAKKGDQIAHEAFDYTAKMLAYAIADMYVIFSPQAVILFGGLANSGEMLFGPVKKYVDEYVFPSYKGSVKILASGIAENSAAVLGSAALAWNELHNK